jgi:hypothetical protein
MKIQKETVKEPDSVYQFAKTLLRIWVDQLVFKVSNMKEQSLQ